MNFPGKKNIYLFIFILLWLSVCLSIVYSGWEPTWDFLQIPTISPMFADMRTVQGALSSVQQGYNPQIENPGDPWGRVMNYPYIWVTIARFFQFGNENAFLLTVGFYVFAFLICGFLLLRDFPSISLLLGLFSGTTLLAVERGNNDLLIFVLLFIGIYVSHNYQRDSIKVLPFLLAIMLKIYPVFTLAGFIKKPKLLIFTIFVTITYFICTFSELKIIRVGNTASGNISYGFKNLSELHPSIKFYSLVFVLSLILLIVLTMNVRFKEAAVVSSKSVDLFITGGIIYVSSYLIAPNWDYRLVFLLLCIPFIKTIQNNIVRISSLASILVSMFIIPLRDVFPIYLSAILKHYVFLVILACLILEFKSILLPFSFPKEFLLPFGKNGTVKTTEQKMDLSELHTESKFSTR